MEESGEKLDLEQITCTAFERKQMSMMHKTEADISFFGSQSAEARGKVLKAQSHIGMLNEKIPSVQSEYDDHKADCKRNIAQLQYELKVVTEDVRILDIILNITDCAPEEREDSPEPAAGGFFIQEEGADAAQSLIRCGGCAGGKGTIMLQHDQISPMLAKLQSSLARAYVQQNFQAAFHEAAQLSAPVMLTQEEVQHRMAQVSSKSSFVPGNVPSVTMKHRLMDGCSMNSPSSLKTARQWPRRSPNIGC